MRRSRRTRAGTTGNGRHEMKGLSCNGDKADRTTLSSYLAAFAISKLVSAGASAATIFQENFASGLGGFTATGSVTTGTFGARLRGSSGTAPQITSGVINTTGFTNVTLSFNRTTPGLEASETAVASFSTDGASFTPIESVRTASGRVTLSLGASAENQSRLFIRFALNANSRLQTYTVANIVLEGTGGSAVARTTVV